jgi:hypothetical protein
MGGNCRKVHFEVIASPGHNQLSAPACLKSDAFPGPILTIEENKSARQCCMAAKRNLCDRSEPSEIKAFSIGNPRTPFQKGCSRKQWPEGSCLRAIDPGGITAAGLPEKTSEVNAST